MSKAALLVLFLYFSISSYSQTEEQKARLLQFSREAAERFAREKAEAILLAEEEKIPVRGITSNGQVFELMKYENGLPVYYVTLNAVSAQTISTDRIYNNGSSGFSLSGIGQRIGIWDEGAVLHEHQEFSGRTVQKDNGAPGGFHPTAVAGTMIAAGIDPDAKGMSYAAVLDCYDWNYDDSELSAAAANGLKVSNHSYGYFTGWVENFRNDGRWGWFGDVNISTSEDYNFGYYNAISKIWDNIAYNAPGLFICYAAGNDRGEGPLPGTEHWVKTGGAWTLSNDTRERDGGDDGYDCISFLAAAKNIFSVGAVHGIPGGYTTPNCINMTSFSVWGPTDDGRIKPEVVADGFNVYTSTNSGVNGYSHGTGTSFSSPAVSGSVGVLLEHQAVLYGISNPFKASTLKTLIIHTADECGANDGPDYRHGWGLMNTLNAVKVMTLDKETGNSLLIKEVNLSQGETFEYQVQSSGIGPLKATIGWTDPPAIVSVPSLNNRMTKLVNDLDLRITGPGGTMMPWVLDVQNPSAPAVRGDNNCDNYEQVFIKSPEAGNYTVTVTHKGTIKFGSQLFSLILTGHILPTPEPVILQRPLNNSMAGSLKPLFEWMRGEKAYDYNIQVALDSLFTNKITDTILTSVNYLPPNNLPEFSTIYWRVRGINSGGDGIWSDTWKFYILPGIASPPVLLFPEQLSVNIKNNSHLVWRSSQSVEEYHVQTAEDSNFVNIVFNDTTVTDTSVMITGLSEYKKYYWRVRGKNLIGYGSFSSLFTFTSAVHKPDSLTADIINSRNIKLDWTDNSSVEDMYYILRKSEDRIDYELIDSLAANSITYTDYNAEPLKKYTYGVYCAAGYNPSDTAFTVINTLLSADDEQQKIPSEFMLSQNYPNPFNPSTVIKYGLPSESAVKAVIFNILGQTVVELVNYTQPAGYHEITWNAADHSSGIYFYSIEASQTNGNKNFREVRKMLLLK